MLKPGYRFNQLCCFLLTVSVSVSAAAAQPEPWANYAGSYRLVSETKTNLDGSAFSCGSNKDGTDMPCQTSKGKIVLEALADKSLVYFEAYTTKGIGTSGSLGNFQYLQNKVLERFYSGEGLLCCNQGLKLLRLEGNRLERQTTGANFKSTSIWQKVGADEVKDKYLERELDKQRKFYLQISRQ